MCRPTSRTGITAAPTSWAGPSGTSTPHDFGGWVEQQYLPDELRDRVYYHFGQNKTEQAALAYRHQQRAPKPEQK